MKIWGIGLGRTGTKSLCKALEILGYKVRHNPPFLNDFDELDAAAEASCVFYYKYLDLRFPGSKFILTTRSLDEWLISNRKAILELFPMERIPPTSSYYNAMIRNRVARWGTIDYNANAMIRRYYEHHSDVFHYFYGREEDLLTMNVFNGNPWQTLCDFLKKPIPAIEFPHEP